MAQDRDFNLLGIAMARMWTIAAIGAALGLAACTPSADEPAANVQTQAPAPDGTRVVGFSGILARSAILFQRPDHSLTQCFFAEGQLSHCSNLADPGAAVVGYTATGSDEGRHDGDEAVLLLQRPDGSLSQCALVDGALSACTNARAVQGRVVGYSYFADASAILIEDSNGMLARCWIDAGRLSNCSSGFPAPGRVIGFNHVGEDGAMILFARADGSLAECERGVDRFRGCSTFTAPFDGAVGYYWLSSAATILFTREDGLLAHCLLVEGALSDCADVPSPP